MKIILIGYRASGKSTVGVLLARKLKIPFCDTDAQVEAAVGMPIKEMVARHGWEYFRAREKAAIKELMRKEDSVIATGGGAVLDDENVKLLKMMGKVIWLDAALPDIIGRLEADAESCARRPQFTESDLLCETTEVLKERIPLYEKAADYSLDTFGKSGTQVAEEIVEYLKSNGDLIKIDCGKD
jgi:shikimate kinase